MEVLDKEPQKLLSIKGIAQRKLKAIIASYEETKALSDLMIYLAPFGVSMKKAAMIKEEFGDNSLKIVKSDPFQLCKIKGFGFMTVDSIARKTKVSLKHPMRYSGAINYVLDEPGYLGISFSPLMRPWVSAMTCSTRIVKKRWSPRRRSDRPSPMSVLSPVSMLRDLVCT